MIYKNEKDISPLVIRTHDARPANSPTERISALDGIRGFAILLVFLFHFTGFYASIDYSLTPGGIGYNIVSFFRAGHIGVDLFFVISGYLITRSLDRNKSGFTFLKHRVARLLPVHFAMCLYIAYATKYWEASTFFLNLSFIAPLIGSAHSYNDVTWTLSLEWIFYLEIFIVYKLFNPGSYRLIFILIFAFVFILSTKYIPKISPIDFDRFSGFIIGVGLAVMPKLYDSKRSRLWSNITAIIAFFSILLLMMLWNEYWREITSLPLHGGFYLAAAFCFAILIRESFAKNGDTIKIFSFSPLRCLGKISYSFYLIHSVMIGTLLNKFNEFGPPKSFLEILFQFFILLSISILVALASYSLLERPYFEKRSLLGGLFKIRRRKWLRS